MQGMRERLKDKGWWATVLIIALFVFVKLLYAQRFHNVIWDEAVYLGIGKWLYSLGHVGLFEIIRPIGVPAIIGLFWKLGLNYVYWAELVEIAFAAGTLVLTYLVAKEWGDSWTGAVAAFILAVTPVFFLYSGYILTGIPSSFFVMLALYLFLKGRSVDAGIAAGFASLFRFPQGMIFGCIFLALVSTLLIKKSAKVFSQLKRFITAFIVVHIPFLLFNYLMYREETSRLHHALFRPWILGSTHTGNLAEAVTTSMGKYLYYPGVLFASNALILLALLGVIYILASKRPLQHKLAFLLAPVMYLGFFGHIINKQERFLLMFIPILAVLAGQGATWLVDKIAVLLKSKRIRSIEAFTRIIKREHLYIVLALVLLIYAYQAPMKTDEGYYGWRTDQPPAIVTQYYSYLAAHPPQGKVITADPVPVAYVDAYFVPIYFSIDAAEQIYRDHLEGASHLVYSNATFYCPPEDQDCIDRVAAFDQEITTKHQPVFDKVYGDRRYYVYQLR